jgi:hypothetical protein
MESRSGPDQSAAQFVQTMTEKLMICGLGRPLEPTDLPSVGKIVRGAARGNYQFSSVIMGVGSSPEFQMAKFQNEPAPRRQRPRAGNTSAHSQPTPLADITNPRSASLAGLRSEHALI